MFIKRFMSALQFATIIPVPNMPAVEPRDMIAYFPLAGLFLGGMLAGVDYLLRQLWPPETVALLDVILLAAITGALHLDGLADTADGLYGRRDRQTSLKIMKDSRVGSMGVVALVCVLTLKWVGLWELSADRELIFLIVPAYARAGVLFAMRSLPYGRSENGTGHGFFVRPIRFKSFAGVLIPVGLSIMLGWRGLVAASGFVIIVGALVAYYRLKLNCVTGDMLGAMIEVTETGLFLLASIGQGS